MKRVLLAAVNAKYIHSNPAVRYLAAYAAAHVPAVAEGQTEVLVREYTINQQMEQIMADIYRAEPEMIGFSCYIWNMNAVGHLVRNLHLILPEVPIWLGGPEVSYDADKILREYPEVTGIMEGEGEKTFAQLLEAYGAVGDGIADLTGVKGITYRHPFTGDICIHEPQEILDLDEVPFFYRDLPAGTFSNRVVYYESSRGCPFRCSYCLSSIDKKVRFRNTELVKKELQFFLDANVPQVKFVDRTFNCDYKHAAGIWEYIREHDNGITNFHFEIAADLLTEEELDLLATLRPGQVQLEIGVQSANSDTIHAIDRVMDLDHLRAVVARIRKGRNIHQHLDLIIGLPEEGMESFARSFDAVYAMEPDQFQVGFLKVLKGSAMYHRAKEYGIVYRQDAPYEVLATNWMDYSEILRLKGIEEMVEVYYNSCQFTHTMQLLTESGESPFLLYQKLADYYEDNGLNERSHSRMDRFRILRDFAVQVLAVPTGEIEAVLLYDLYLRENSRSRPAWAPDPSRGKAIFKEYFRELCGDKVDHRMLHGEVLDTDPAGFGGEGPWYVVFDYRRRDPLSGNAFVHVIEPIRTEGRE
ncbi:MAG: B12-binding domain-containing radical SAM protein [Eubacteriales bacterium]|nr:B12-binding domain-containing radical SAM protein [Eubacteriales bacterium]